MDEAAAGGAARTAGGKSGGVFVTVTLRVTGDVHGVGYRAFSKRTALRLGVTGFSRNEPDGSVVVSATGTGAGVDAFVLELKKTSPNLTRIEEIQLVNRVETDSAPSGFEII